MASNQTNNELEKFLPFNSPVAADELKDAAKENLGETEELKENCLRQLKVMIEDHRMLCINRDDFLLRFLRVKKFDVKRSFKSLRNYAHQRVEIQKNLLKLQPETLKKIFHLNMHGFLPYRDNNQRLILFSRPGVWNSSICTFDELMMSAVLLLNYASEDPSSQINGMVTLHNYRLPVPFNHLTHLLRYLPFFKNFLYESLPLRYGEIHIINEPSYFKYVLQLMYPFTPEKIWKKKLLHGESRDVFFQYISPTILPDDFGGYLGPLTCDHLVEEMTDYLTKIKEEQHYFFPQK